MNELEDSLKGNLSNPNWQPPNDKATINFYKKHQHNVNAMYYLGLLYHKQGKYSKARKLYEQAAQQNHPLAISDLGYMYWHGKGVTRNEEKAIQLYKQAVQLNCAHAMNNLAYIYEDRFDITKAIPLYQKSAELNLATGNRNLGMLYAGGKGVEKNIAKAIELLQRAISLGHKGAIEDLAHIFEKEGKVNDAFELYLQNDLMNNVEFQDFVKRNIKDMIGFCKQLYDENKRLYEENRQQYDTIQQLYYFPGGPGYCESKEDFEQRRNEWKHQQQ